MPASMNWTDARKLIAYSEGGILSKIIPTGTKMNLTLFCMAAGTDISEHTTTKEGFAYIIEGKGVFRINGEDVRMLPGVIILIPRDARHSLRAEENTSFLLALS